MTDIKDRVYFYVINLDRSIDRFERFQKSFEAFPIVPVRVSAIEGKKITLPVKEYNAKWFYTLCGREALPGEIGCYLSHVKVLQIFLESDKEFAIICEDDATPTAECFEAITKAIAFSDSWDMLRLCGGRSKTSFRYQNLTPSHHLCTSITGLWSAAAYMVNKKAASILVKKLLPMTDLYDSALFHGRVGIKEATIFPNCMTISDLGHHSTIEYGLKRNLRPWNIVFWSCRLHRLSVRTVRYSLQILRLIKRGISRSKDAVRAETFQNHN